MVGTAMLKASSAVHVGLGMDIGGTHTQVCIVNAQTGEIIDVLRFETRMFSSVDEVIAHVISYLHAYQVVWVHATIAGRRQPNGDVEMTNTDCPVFEPATATIRFGILVWTGNDMEGAGAGLPWSTNHVVVYFGRHKQQVVTPFDEITVVVTVSSGVGVAIRLPNGIVIPTEFGHATWQPRDACQMRLLESMRKGGVLVTVENVVSGGSGFLNLYRFFEQEARWWRRPWTNRLRPSKEIAANVKERLRHDKPIGDLITEGALNGDPFCIKAMQVLGSVLGQHLRNVVLSTLATGGVYLIGGVASPEFMLWPSFLHEFIGEGARHDDMMRGVPITVVKDPDIGAKGAAALGMKAAAR
jgi:glucokinase